MGLTPTQPRPVAGAICERGGEAVADAHTVSTPEGGRAIVGLALEAFGPVDIVINNAVPAGLP